MSPLESQINNGKKVLIKNKTKKKRRGGKKKFKKLNIISTNANGLTNKEENLKSEIKYFNAAIFSIQETNYSVKGKFKLANYKTFEIIRDKDG